MSARTIVKRVATVADRVVRPPDGLTVLIYHRVGGGSSSEVDLDLAEAMIEREPITVVVSKKGWIRALKGHVQDLSSLQFIKEFIQSVDVTNFTQPNLIRGIARSPKPRWVEIEVLPVDGHVPVCDALGNCLSHPVPRFRISKIKQMKAIRLLIAK